MQTENFKQIEALGRSDAVVSMMTKNENISKIELLAPAGGFEQLIAALNAGADSVYLGFTQYGARAYAQNFNFNQLRKAADRAHNRGVKIYLTLNTIIKDDEIYDIIYFLNNYIDICKDGIIIQDAGLCRMLNDLFPDIPMHASTQMNIHNSNSLDLYAGAGLKRTVLAREMTLEEIKGLSNKTKVDLEIFGHGSQCYSYSGKCYFSSFTGGRSGNRGRCTQPCRMKYTLVRSDGGKDVYLSKDPSYLLSKKDICTLEMLPEIIGAGIKALKIEGRMKSSEYVSIVVRTYRKYIDLYYRDPKNYSVREEDIYKINQIFSRQLCSGYYKNSSAQNIMDPGRSGSIGNFIGRIKKIDHAPADRGRKGYGRAESIYIKSKAPIWKGDILEIWTRKGNKKITVKNIDKIKEKGKYYYRIGLNGEYGLSIKDRIIKYFDKKVDEEAKALYKYNDADIKDCTRASDKKISGIHNREKLNKYLERYHIEEGAGKVTEFGKIKLTAKIYSSDVLESISYSDADQILFSNHRDLLDGKMAKNEMLQNLIRKNDPNKQLIIDLPDIIYDRDINKLESEIEILIGGGVKYFRASNPGILKILGQYCNNDGHNSIKIIMGNSFNISNIAAVDFYYGILGSRANISGFELSPEINMKESRSIIDSFKKMHGKKKDIDFSIFAHGFFKVMTARCDISFYADKSKPDRGGLFFEDRKKYRFRTEGDENSNTLIYNSKNICSIFDLDKIISAGINNLLIDAIFMEPEDINKILKNYKKALRLLASKKIDAHRSLMDNLSKDPLFMDYSKGQLFKGVE